MMIDLLYFFFLRFILLDICLILNIFLFTDIFFSQISDFGFENFAFFIHAAYNFLISVVSWSSVYNIMMNQEIGSFNVNLYQLVFGLQIYRYLRKFYFDYNFILCFLMIFFNKRYDLVAFCIFLSHGCFEMYYFLMMFLIPEENVFRRNKFTKLNFNLITFFLSPFYLMTSILWLNYAFEDYTCVFGFLYCISNLYTKQYTVSKNYFELLF